MNRILKSFISIAFVMAILFAGCNKDKSDEVSSVTLNKAELALLIGNSETLTATIMPVEAENNALTWVSDKPLVAEVDANGKVTAVSTGTATITATSANEIKGTCVVTVEDIKRVLITKGTFMMGSPTSEPDRSEYDNETHHQVTLTKDFWMSTNTITNAQYATFLNSKGIGSQAMINFVNYGPQALLVASSGTGKSINGNLQPVVITVL